ncbi:hypothetical protein AB0H34_24090 [Saccharopolyspora shandongensis]|uniref:hypothetical protein n=1 Tax=Saccharopolyspora shandongensis TaxID=418495 RepID=UPI0034011473
MLLLSVMDGALIGVGAGAGYGLVVALLGSIGPNRSFSGFLGLAIIGGIVAALTGLVAGVVFGTIFGAVSLFRVRRVVLLEVSVIAILGIVIILLAATGTGGVTSALLLWTASPLVAGVPAAALHGRRLRRRVDT